MLLDRSGDPDRLPVQHCHHSRVAEHAVKWAVQQVDVQSCWDTILRACAAVSPASGATGGSIASKDGMDVDAEADPSSAISQSALVLNND